MARPPRRRSDYSGGGWDGPGDGPGDDPQVPPPPPPPAPVEPKAAMPPPEPPAPVFPEAAPEEFTRPQYDFGLPAPRFPVTMAPATEKQVRYDLKVTNVFVEMQTISGVCVWKAPDGPSPTVPVQDPPPAEQPATVVPPWKLMKASAKCQAKAGNEFGIYLRSFDIHVEKIIDMVCYLLVF